MPTTPKRAACPACLRPQRTCICSLATPVRHVTQVLILQHPLEVHEAKGSARLLHRCLPHSRIVVGEQFSADLLHSLLYDAWPDAHSEEQASLATQPILLYPESAAGQAPREAGMAERPVANTVKQFRLVLLDGTWRKSRKMLHRNPMLATLPRLSLAETAASRYLIRKAHRPEQLSTLEAACYALMELEQDTERFQPLLDAFEEFVARQMRYAQAAAADAD